MRKAGDGDEVVVRGRIAGQAEPFTEGRAQFQLVDLGVKSLRRDARRQLRDAVGHCCEDKKSVAANSVTVQVVGPDGGR